MTSEILNFHLTSAVLYIEKLKLRNDTSWIFSSSSFHLKVINIPSLLETLFLYTKNHKPLLMRKEVNFIYHYHYMT